MKSPRYSLICLILTTDNYLIRAVESLFVTKVMTTFLLLTGGGRETDWLVEGNEWVY